MLDNTGPGEHLIERGLEILEMLYNFGTDIVDYDEKLYKSMRMISDGLKDIEGRNMRVWCNGSTPGNKPPGRIRLIS